MDSLGPGAVPAFAIVWVPSGATVGADIVVLPAVFSVVLTRARLSESQAFGLWSFAGKLRLALAAFLVLRALQSMGFTPGMENSDTALGARWPMRSCPAR